MVEGPIQCTRWILYTAKRQGWQGKVKWMGGVIIWARDYMLFLTRRRSSGGVANTGWRPEWKYTVPVSYLMFSKDRTTIFPSSMDNSQRIDNPLGWNKWPHLNLNILPKKTTLHRLAFCNIFVLCRRLGICLRYSYHFCGIKLVLIKVFNRIQNGHMEQIALQRSYSNRSRIVYGTISYKSPTFFP